MKIDQNVISKIKSAKKINIIGCPGAGKSTLGKKLSKVLSLPVVFLDTIYWKPNWVSLPKEEFVAKMLEETKKESWIMDGNYEYCLDKRLDKADFNIYLDLSTFTCLTSAYKRYFIYKNKTRSDMTEGCHEVMDKEFVSFIMNYNKKSRKINYELLKNANVDYLILKSRKQAHKLVKLLTQEH